MGYLYRPKLKDPTPLPPPTGKRCTHAKHGREDTCPGCGARFSAVWWVKYYVNGRAVRESTETEKETEAKRFLKDREGSAVKGQPVLPKVDRVTYEEAAHDLRRHYKTTGEREEKEAEGRLKNLDQFFQGRRPYWRPRWIWRTWRVTHATSEKMSCSRPRRTGRSRGF